MATIISDDSPSPAFGLLGLFCARKLQNNWNQMLHCLWKLILLHAQKVCAIPLLYRSINQALFHVVQMRF